MSHSLTSVFQKIDSLKPQFFSRLTKAIQIPAVSSDESLRSKVFDKAKFISEQLSQSGFHDIKMVDLGIQPPPISTPNLSLPPVILSRFGSDPSKKDCVGLRSL